jgi:hypothetical protein
MSYDLRYDKIEVDGEYLGIDDFDHTDLQQCVDCQKIKHFDDMCWGYVCVDCECEKKRRMTSNGSV